MRFTPSSAETVFTLKGTYYTNASGYYSIVPNLDVQSYQFEVRLENLSMPALTATEARYPLLMLLNNTSMNSKLWYQMDINSDGRIKVSDSYNIYGKMSGRFASWVSPNYRIFNSAQWSVINIGTTDLRLLYPGVQSTTITPVNGGSTNFYLIRTGFTN